MLLKKTYGPSLGFGTKHLQPPLCQSLKRKTTTRAAVFHKLGRPDPELLWVRIPQEENVSWERDIWTTPLNPLLPQPATARYDPLSPGLDKTKINEWTFSCLNQIRGQVLCNQTFPLVPLPILFFKAILQTVITTLMRLDLFFILASYLFISSCT